MISLLLDWLGRAHPLHWHPVAACCCSCNEVELFLHLLVVIYLIDNGKDVSSCLVYY